MKEDPLNKKIEDWKRDIQSNNWELALSAADKLGEIGGEDIISFLIKLLGSKQANLRNAAALSIRAAQDDRAITPLLKAIFKPENRNYNGTLVYALGSLNCKDILVELFKILFYESYESKMGAYAILEEQVFEFSREDLLEIQRMWKACNNKTVKSNGFEDEETLLMMKDTYEGFMAYLEE